MTQTLMAAHQPSNNRVSTDEFLTHPSQFTYEENRETIASKKELYEYIEITDEQIAKVRGEYSEDRGKGYNELTIGDAVALILCKEFKDGYQGLIDPNEEEIMQEKGLTASTEESIMNTRKKSKSIVDSYYDFDNLSTLYFLK